MSQEELDALALRGSKYIPGSYLKGATLPKGSNVSMTMKSSRLGGSLSLKSTLKEKPVDKVTRAQLLEFLKKKVQQLNP